MALKIQGTRKSIIDRRLSPDGKTIIRVLACGHMQPETRGGEAKFVTEANCKQCALSYVLRHSQPQSSFEA